MIDPATIVNRRIRKHSRTTAQVSIDLPEVKAVYDSRKRVSDCPKIASSQDCFQIARKLYDSARIGYVEEFYILLLTRANRVLGWSRISVGGQHGTVVDPKVIFAIALGVGAVGIVLVHNHPSGNLTPSEADRKLTKKMKDAGILMEVNVLDHLIITEDENIYYSFADEGIL